MICVFSGAKVLTLAATAFTLSWSHSVEKTRWEEDWRLTPAGLEVVEARVQGSGAGMEPPEGAVLREGRWVYQPALPPQPELILASSGAVEAGWTLCSRNGCIPLRNKAGDPFAIRACTLSER